MGKEEIAFAPPEPAGARDLGVLQDHGPDD